VYFVAIVEQNKKRIKKKEQKIEPVVKFQPFPTIFDATSEWLGAACQKFVSAFRSLIHSWKRNILRRAELL
jgi:hypothetical protein